MNPFGLLKAKEARAIANKLECEIQNGRKHDNAIIRWNGKYIAQFGIRRDAKASHDYIPNQIFISLRQAQNLARCPLSRDEYFQILQQKSKLE